MQFIGIDSSRLRGPIAKSVLPNSLPVNWGNASYRRAEPEWTVREWLRGENVNGCIRPVAVEPSEDV
jgi:hypothetical protein